MDNATVARIVKRYGYIPATFLPVEKGYRNESHPYELSNGQRLNLIIYKRETGIVVRIRNANSVSGFLANRGLPCRRTIDGRIMQLSAGQRHRYAALYSYLPGQTIPWEGYTRKHIKLLGKTMSDMHAALGSYDMARLPDVADEYLQILKRAQQYFGLSSIRQAMHQKLRLDVPVANLAKYIFVLEACKGLPDQQALHMDFVRSNILFNNDPSAPSPPFISGILDFEKTARGHCLFDIARTLAFLLVDCKHTPAVKVRKYFLYSGYEKRGGHKLQRIAITIQGEKIELLECLLDIFMLHDFYKFLKHNPYESLQMNEHYIRTRDILFTRKLLIKSETSNRIESK
ncbi:MAG TPA: phosphotransferase [Candidatus Saccharimonadales bacterium]|nr:phosphotransferase [Candidatus Saccharimonadales bacterium]